MSIVSVSVLAAVLLLILIFSWKIQVFLTGDQTYNDDLMEKPYDGVAYFNRGFDMSCSKCHEKAVRDFSKAIELGVNKVDAYLLRGDSLVELNRYDEALRDFSRLINQNRDDPWLCFQMARALHGTKNYDEAHKYMAMAIVLSPENEDFYYHQGNIFWDEGRFDEAQSAYETSLQINPENLNIYLKRGRRFLSLNLFSEAKNEFIKAYNLDFKCFKTMELEIDIFWKSRKYKHVFKKLCKHVSLNPYHLAMYLKLVLLLAACPDKAYRNRTRSKLLSKVERSKDLGNEDISLICHIARLFAVYNDFELAKRWQKKAIKLAKEKVEKTELENILHSYEIKEEVVDKEKVLNTFISLEKYIPKKGDSIWDGVEIGPPGDIRFSPEMKRGREYASWAVDDYDFDQYKNE